MQIGIIGINHKSAELKLREEISKICFQGFSIDNFFPEPMVLLSTCNRTELYFSSDNLADSHSTILNALKQKFPFPLEHKLYSYFGKDCFLHLASVTAGLDSAIIGESEIQGQVKKAYEVASLSQELPSALHFLFQKCLKIGKDLRSKLPLYRTMPSLQDSIFQTATYHLESLHQKKILLVGLSEINKKILKLLKIRNLKSTICNRTFSKVQSYIGEDIDYLLWQDLNQWVKFDWIVFATKSPHYLLNYEEFSTSVSKKHLLMDLSVPRNVDPKFGKHPGIKLVNVDHLTQGIDRKRKTRACEIPYHEILWLEKMVERQLDIFEARNMWKKKLYYFTDNIVLMPPSKARSFN